eukprot:NODE_102_length_19640_cov_1.308735.p6 type:complete len:508 gc:universal NODE_102_length_19640_cov_1.308735:18022-16499(-)
MEILNEKEIKSLRNKVIGNPFEKLKYINNGTFDALLKTLENQKAPNLLQHTLIFISSCLLMPEAKISYEATEMIWDLFVKVDNKETKVASAKCLRSIYDTHNFPINQANILSIVDNLQLSQTGSSFKLSLVLCELLSKICRSKQHQHIVAESGGIDKMIQLLSSDNMKLISTCLQALAAVIKENEDISKYVIGLKLIVNQRETDLIQLLLTLVKTMKNHSDKLIVCSCIVNLFATNVASNITKDIHLIVLPTLVKLLPTEVGYKAAFVLAYLTAGNEDLQKNASEAEAIPKLSDVVRTWTEDSSDSTMLDVEASLTALAAIASLREDCRKRVIDTKVLSVISRLLECSRTSIRSAACQLTRSLSRSVKTLRTALVDANIVKSILKLLMDQSEEVQISACATLCNIVLDFSPVKDEVTDNGGIEKLVELSKSKNSKLRLNAIWALKNLVYQSKTDLKRRVMACLTYSNLTNLLEDDPQVQEHALNLIRNLACMEEKVILIYLGYRRCI